MLNLEQQRLHNLAIGISRQLRKCEARLVDVLLEIDQTKLHKKVGCSSLFVYAVKFLGLDESVAYSTITVARKARDMPRLKQALQKQTLSIAKANRIVSTLTPENAEHLVEFAEKHPTAEINREVSRLRRGAGLKEILKTLQVSEETYAKIKRAKSLMAGTLDLDQVLGTVLDEHLQHHDPVKKAERAVERKADELCTYRVTARRPLTARQKHTVIARDQGRCTHTDTNGERCGNERYLHLHHIQPVSQGGSNHPDNLTTLCSFHHDLVHQLSLPIEGQVSWLRESSIEYRVS